MPEGNPAFVMKSVNANVRIYRLEKFD